MDNMNVINVSAARHRVDEREDVQPLRWGRILRVSAAIGAGFCLISIEQGLIGLALVFLGAADL